jgi:peptide/nickel transport system substrate-binding protein
MISAQSEVARRVRLMRFRSKALGALVAAAATAAALAACSSTSSAPATGTTPVSGGTATFAELPATTPNYIFPFTSSAYISVSNTDLFQYLLYRPLYWFGTGNSPTANTLKSVADLPVWSNGGKTVTITLKPYKWSNGQPLTAQNIVFWLNMEDAVGDVDYGAYTGFPNTEVSSMKIASPNTLVLNLNKAYNQQWFLYNDLSQVTPMPEAWDRTASGPSSCSTTVSDCAAVYKYLDAQSRNLAGYVSSPLWSIVDGPWKLTQFNSDGFVAMVPNPAYSGPDKPHLSQFEELPFTTDAAEYDVMRAPSSSSKIDVGYIPSEDLSPKPAGAAVGANPMPGYTLAPWDDWGISFYTMNEQDTIGDHGAIIRQLYFRQAMAYLLNGQAVLQGPLKGYGSLTTGPVAPVPATSWLSPQEGTNAFPYNPAKAKSLLTSHGWTVTPGGTDTCTNPSLCGAGITKGSTLNFTFAYVTGLSWVTAEMTQLQSNALAVGIKLNLKPEPFNTVVAGDSGNCVVAKLPCNWDMADWGLGWSFYPDVLPTGETLFECGAIANSGGYCDKTDDSMIEQTLDSSNLSYMYTWENYLQTQLPVEWQPNAPYQITEVVDNLKGVLPQEPTLNITPEDWYYVK